MLASDFGRKLESISVVLWCVCLHTACVQPLVTAVCELRCCASCARVADLAIVVTWHSCCELLFECIDQRSCAKAAILMRSLCSDLQVDCCVVKTVLTCRPMAHSRVTKLA